MNPMKKNLVCAKDPFIKHLLSKALDNVSVEFVDDIKTADEKYKSGEYDAMIPFELDMTSYPVILGTILLKSVLSFLSILHHLLLPVRNDLKYRVLTVQNACKGTFVSLICEKVNSETPQPKYPFLSLLNKNATWKSYDFQFPNLAMPIGMP